MTDKNNPLTKALQNSDETLIVRYHPSAGLYVYKEKGVYHFVLYEQIIEYDPLSPLNPKIDLKTLDEPMIYFINQTELEKIIVNDIRTRLLTDLSLQTQNYIFTSILKLKMLK